MKVSIIGATGYSGLELIRLLQSHSKVTIQSLHSYSNYSENIAYLYPHLKDVCELSLESVDIKKICQTSQIVFFATPSGVSKDQAAAFIKAGLIVVDLSGDLRLENHTSYKKWYNFDGASQELLTQAVYGLAEWNDVTNQKLIANPGCYATATLLALAPLLIEDILHLDSIVVDAKSGVSGAGKTPNPSSMYTETNDNLTLYKVNQHQHIPEIMQQLKKWNPSIENIQFSTTLIPVTRGILATIYGKLKSTLTTEEVVDLFQKAYQDKPFVRIQEVGNLPTIKQVVGSNYCDIGISVNPVTNQVLVVATIDNLIKGAAGQAIQNMNQAAGFPLNTGLQFSPLYP
ncbi:N-acetyl-gamma-glutamyl-phosphate reductase [Carnobacterium gallinarum]|uniref:N-acetyl-gamma-glutamyl-phosphate reductase n=1 Tax=Carnobacterium gallinarum TaxID=2749 RepID=UPI000552D9CA|nr:N-acetyl-gamma-glutamyl-phosphate reductase [Carnobacterium gallinarum]